VITVAYLAPQFGWINENFGVLGSLDPFKNAGRERVIDITCNAACQKVTNSIMGATAFAALGACVAILVIGRRRPETRLPLLVLCFLAPFLTLLGQSYGGEAILRVVMFSAPFSGMLLALALMTFKRAWLKRVLAVGVMLVLGYGFLYAYFGIEEDRYVTPSDVKANQYLYAHAPESSLAVPLAPNVPGQLSYNYWQVYSPYAGIFINPKILKQPYTDHMVDDLAEWVGEQTDDAFVIFNPEMETIAENVGVMLPGVSEKLEKAMVESGRFTLWHQDGDTKIYRLVPRPGPN
jgi:hypothetical protein